MTDEADSAPDHGAWPYNTWLGAPSKPDPDVPNTWHDSERLAFYVGSFVIGASRLDSNLTQLLAWLGHLAEQPRQRVAGQSMSTKIRMLRKLIPGEWAELTRALDRMSEHRNTLAHSFWTPDMEAFKETGELQTVLLREKAPGTPFRINFESLWTEQVDQQLISHVILLLSQVVMAHSLAPTYGYLSPTDLGDLRTWVLSWADTPNIEGWPKEPQWPDDVARVFRAA